MSAYLHASMQYALICPLAHIIAVFYLSSNQNSVLPVPCRKKRHLLGGPDPLLWLITSYDIKFIYKKFSIFLDKSFVTGLYFGKPLRKSK